MSSISVDEDEEIKRTDGVLMIDLEPNEHAVELCSHHYLLPSTVIQCLEGSIRVKVQYHRNRKGEFTIHPDQNPHLMTFRCPCFVSLDDGGRACNTSFPIEVISEQIPDDLREEYENTLHSVYKRKVRKAIFAKIDNVEECPNTSCLNEGHHGIGQVISPTTWNLYVKKKIFLVPREYIRECRSCGSVWCSLCKVHYFGDVKRMNHATYTCKDLIDMSDPSSCEALSHKLINQVAVKCPGCSILISVFEGCNRVKCTHCDKVFCYICQDVAYTTANECYEHLKKVHGGFYDKNIKRIPKNIPKKGAIDRIKKV